MPSGASPPGRIWFHFVFTSTWCQSIFSSHPVRHSESPSARIFRPRADGAYSSSQSMGSLEKGTCGGGYGGGGGYMEANEAVKKRGRGRPRIQLSFEEEEKRKKKKNERDRDDRAKKKSELISLRKLKELYKKFCENKVGIAKEFKAFCKKHEEKEDGANQHSDQDQRPALEENLEMIQTVELEVVTAVNSSSLGAMGTEKREKEHDGANQGKRPATAYTTPRCHPIGGFMADARQNDGHALATQGSQLSTNKGTQIQMREATHDGEASTSSWEPAPHCELGVSVYDPLKMIKAAVTLGGNLMKGLLQSMPPGSEFVNLPLLDTIQRYPSLQNQLNEGLTLIGQGHPIDDKVAMQSDDPPVVVPRSFFSLHNWLESVACEPNVFAPSVDADNIAANARANNVEQEDDANYQRMDEATEADLCVSMWLRDPDGGEDP
ncbi:hypothetical protein SLEP1_g29656 [Rubroshorea leprosula]|uniref:Uncharacterized protein n=1 Tax=Rubroshorea leprosula TaxID=152421 RepID=A0AAV5K3G3_9ROSI|nr:hypothetical protein SLEP1_g29656 [Rubroshorea leprosula]